MSSDRLAAMKAAAAANLPSAISSSSPAGGYAAVQVDEDPLEQCKQIMQSVQNIMHQISAKTVELRARSAIVLQSANPVEDKSNEAVNEIMGDVTRLSNKAKKFLDELLASSQRLADAEENAATIKIQAHQHRYLSDNLLRTLLDYRAAVTEHESAIRAQTARRIKLSHMSDQGCTITDAQADQMAEQVLDLGTDDALVTQARGMLHGVLENRTDLRRMERSMRELNQLFNDLALICNEQTEVLDLIWHSAHASVNEIAHGTKILGEVRGAEKKRRPFRWWLVAIIVVIFILCLAILLGLVLK
jgi:syntaxin 1B/2/3